MGDAPGHTAARHGARIQTQASPRSVSWGLQTKDPQCSWEAPRAGMEDGEGREGERKSNFVSDE